MTSIQEDSATLSRRGFLKGTAAFGAIAAASGMSLAGCAPMGKGSADSLDAALSETGKSVTADDVASFKLDLPEAAPIAPLEVPEMWDDEVDVVVVGTGGGGLAASVYCAEAGLAVVTVEKESTTGGATKHACGWFTLPGGSKAQNEIEYAYPSYPYDRKAFLRAIAPYYEYSFDQNLIAEFAEKGAECTDWMIAHGAPLVCTGPLYLDARVKGGIQPAGMKFLTDDFTQLAVDSGVDLRTNTACAGLVMEDGRVVGVRTQATDGDEDRYVKAAKGVILCTGSFGMNRDMLAKYVPTALRTCTVGGPFPFATGECTRMAIGAGADMCGIDSYCAWEAYPDRYHDGDGEFWTYHWDGSVILCRQPWLTIDKLGNHLSTYTNRTAEHAMSFGGDGDYINSAEHMSRMGGRGYVLFDADYEKHMEITGEEGEFASDRSPLTPERIESAGIDADAITSLCSLDWREDANAAIDRGDIKKADTLEELAELLGLRSEVVVKAVEEWNAVCEKGVDDRDVMYPYNPEWLIPIEKAPFYGARISGGIGKTFAGPRVTSKMEVVNTDGAVIPGLYAHFMTAGGICGESFFNGTMFNTSIQGGNAASWISGYMCAQSVVAS